MFSWLYLYMKKLNQILKEIEQGKISADTAEQQILDIFNVKTLIESGQKICDCPECGAEIINGLSEETTVVIKNSKLFDNSDSWLSPIDSEREWQEKHLKKLWPGYPDCSFR